MGLVDPISPGVVPGSDVAHFALLGYDPFRFYTGRGSLEAVGAGIRLAPTDVAFRCNFATVDENLTVVDRRAGRIKEHTQDLAESLNGMRITSAPDVAAEFHSTIEHRAVLVLRGPSISRMVSDTDPHATNIKVAKSTPLDETPASKKTAVALNEFTEKSFEILQKHEVNIERRSRGQNPANIVIARGPGTLPPITPLTVQYGLKAACVAAIPMVRGICKISGMEVLNVEGATGGLDTNLDAKAHAALEASEKNDLVFLHVKATDIPSHDGDFEMKKKILEKIDKMFGTMFDQIDLGNTYIALTADHATPISVRDHSADPVPIVIAGPDFPPSGLKKFSEKNSAHGNIGRIRALDIIPMIADRLGRAKKFGF